MIFIDDLCKSFTFYVNTGLFLRTKKQVEVVKHVSFEVQPGEVLGLIGANGAGKTTIVKITAGVLRADSGRVLVRGENPFLRSKAYRRDVSILLGNKGKLHPDMSILETATLYGSMYGIGRLDAESRTRELAHRLSLRDDDLRKQTRTLSLGQHMKGELCVALVNSPQILFLDEPTLGLDLTSMRTIRQFIREYCWNNHACCILTSHNLGDIKEASSKLLVIDQGKSLYFGPTLDLPGQFESSTTIRFQIDTQDRQALNQWKGLRYSDGFFSISCPSDQTDAMLNRLYALGEVHALEVTPDSFEEIVERIMHGE